MAQSRLTVRGESPTPLRSPPVTVRRNAAVRQYAPAGVEFGEARENLLHAKGVRVPSSLLLDDQVCCIFILLREGAPSAFRLRTRPFKSSLIEVLDLATAEVRNKYSLPDGL
jgi:hypothetical protein